MEKTMNGEGQAFYLGAVDREPRAVTNALLERMENEGFDVALIAFMNPVGDVQVATSTNVEVRSFVDYLHEEWLPGLERCSERLLGN